MEWIKFSPHNLPPQGLKILCFKKGDLWIARRLEYEGKNYYLEVPYGGELGSIPTDEPDYWTTLKLPEKYTGYMKVSVEDSELMTIDELQEKNPEAHNEFVSIFLKSIIPGQQKKK